MSVSVYFNTYQRVAGVHLRYQRLNLQCVCFLKPRIYLAMGFYEGSELKTWEYAFGVDHNPAQPIKKVLGFCNQLMTCFVTHFYIRDASIQQTFFPLSRKHLGVNVCFFLFSLSVFPLCEYSVTWQMQTVLLQKTMLGGNVHVMQVNQWVQGCPTAQRQV